MSDQFTGDTSALVVWPVWHRDILSAYDLAFMLKLSADWLAQIMKISLCAIMCEEVRLLHKVLHDWTEIHNLAAWQAEEVLMLSQSGDEDAWQGEMSQNLFLF